MKNDVLQLLESKALIRAVYAPEVMETPKVNQQTPQECVIDVRWLLLYFCKDWFLSQRNVRFLLDFCKFCFFLKEKN